MVGLSTLLAAGCSAVGGQGADPPPKATIDHSTTNAAAPVLADLGPVAGTLAESWHVDTRLPGDDGSPDHRASRRLVAGQLIVAAGTGVDVYDARTGRPRWHYREPGRRLTGYAETSGSIVVQTDDQDPAEAKPRWTGLATATGRVEWTSRALGHSFPQVGLDIPAGGGVLPLLPRTKADFEGVRGLDARTGHTRWTRPVADHGCTAGLFEQLSAEDTDGSLFVVKEKCPGHVRMIALDPATGHRRWVRDPGGDQHGAVVVRHGVALFQGAQAVSIVAADGHDLVDGRNGYGCAGTCRFEVAGDHAVVARLTGRKQVLMVDLRNGRATTRPVTELYDALTVAAGHVYGLGRRLGKSVDEAGAAQLLPAALDVIDPATGTIQTRPAPFATSDPPEVTWIGVAGQRLYTGGQVARAARTTAYATVRNR